MEYTRLQIALGSRKVEKTQDKHKQHQPAEMERPDVLSGEQVKEAQNDREIGGFENRPEPTRFGDWDVNGRCSDF